MNAIAYKEIFKLINKNEMWLGYNSTNGMSFKIPNNKSMKHMGFACWFTNLDYKTRHEDIILYKKYIREEYPKYDDYNAINVNKTKEIPIDYDGVMGVPISFLDKYNPDQFEIIGRMSTTKVDEFNFGYPYINGKKLYARILIKNKRDIK